MIITVYARRESYFVTKYDGSAAREMSRTDMQSRIRDIVFLRVYARRVSRRREIRAFIRDPSLRQDKDISGCII